MPDLMTPRDEVILILAEYMDFDVAEVLANMTLDTMLTLLGIEAP